MVEPDLSEVEGLIRPIGVDLFYARSNNPVTANSQILAEPKLVQQSQERREIYALLNEIFSKVKDENLDLHQAVDQGLIPPSTELELYKRLISFFRSDPYNSRLILYFPSQLLPDLSVKREGEAEEIVDRFRKSYYDSWLKLLFYSDPRASFTDGDILEPTLGQPVMVRKAAHLIPDILRNRLVSIPEIITILEIVEEDELIQSLTEGLISAYGHNLIDPINWQQILALSQRKSRIAAVLDSYFAKKNSKFDNLSVESLKRLKRNLDIDHLLAWLRQKIDEFDLSVQLDSDYIKKASPKRLIWERAFHIDQFVEDTAQLFSQRLLSEDIQLSEISDYYKKDNLENAHIRAIVRGVVRTGEAFGKVDITTAQKLTADAEPLFLIYGKQLRLK